MLSVTQDNFFAGDGAGGFIVGKPIRTVYSVEVVTYISGLGVIYFLHWIGKIQVTLLLYACNHFAGTVQGLLCLQY